MRRAYVPEPVPLWQVRRKDGSLMPGRFSHTEASFLGWLVGGYHEREGTTDDDTRPPADHSEPGNGV